jgi:flagellar hook assembly protein FlgD
MGWLDHNWVGVEDSNTASVIPDTLSLTCSSNPFEESVIINFEGAQIPEHLIIYDTSGRLVRRLQCSGEGSFLWDGRDSRGVNAAAGCYTVYALKDTELRGLRIVKLN